MYTPFAYEAELQHRRDQIREEVAAARRRRHPRVRFPQLPAGTLLPGPGHWSTA
ncbi:hypothetical protein AB0N29_14940 [Nocardioides sp. NPDC092400]|uniref:hypothetical protein n=1 Tax=Nocardioides sp. NPDC092400 TaxID=3155196 RepID=UPI00341994E9